MIKIDIFEYDRAEGCSLLCGVDEAGRGPLAGDLYAAAVILPTDCMIDGLNDSKKLTEKKRDELFDVITATAVAYSVGIATIEEIERLNILQATMLAMKRAVDGLSVNPKLVLVDGNRNPHLDVHSRCVVKGDATSAAIAAASIIAKVSRDRYMDRLAEAYPQYQFDKHKGYGTQLHYQMLDEHGVSAVHRPSFLKKYLSGALQPAQQRGIAGERAVTDYLLTHGYEIIDRNVSYTCGEIDIVARPIGSEIIAVVEVKARQHGQPMTAKEAVTPSKQKKLIKTAALYLMKRGITAKVRFDVAEVYFKGNTITDINYIENAFSGDDSFVFI